MINDWIKTGIFAAVGLIVAIVAASVYYANLPNTDVVAQRVGQPFFEQFNDISQAKKVRVAKPSIAGTENEITLELSDELWRIPSRSYYPAEDSDRLGNTVSLPLGLIRQALVSRESNSHAKYHVEDPLDEDSNPETAGTRLTLWDSTNNVLADLIIGRKVEVDADKREIVSDDLRDANQHYVRHPDEREVYQVAITADLTHEFAEWIKPELLQVTNDELNSVEFKNYEIKPEAVVKDGSQYAVYLKEPTESETLVRDQVSDQWSYQGLIKDSEEPNTENIQKTINALTSLEIVDVRRKFEYDGKLVLNPQLEIDNIHPALMNAAQQDLANHGFAVINADRDRSKFTIASTTGKGELNVGTRDGVRYVIYFGDDFVSSMDRKNGINPGAENPDSSTAQDRTETPDENSETKSAATNMNRYVMIRVEYDQTLAGPTPIAPIQPEQPVMPEAIKQGLTFNANASDLPPVPVGVARVSPIDRIRQEYSNTLMAYQRALQQYENDKSQYEQDLKEYNERLENGKKKVAELNERFGSWFYVVNSDALKELKFDRDFLVSAKLPDSTPPSMDQGLNSRPNFNLPPGSIDQLPGNLNNNQQDDDQ